MQENKAPILQPHHQKAWAVILTYLSLYVISSMFAGYWGGIWEDVNRAWLIFGFLLILSIIFLNIPSLKNKKNKTAWLLISIGLAGISVSSLLSSGYLWLAPLIKQVLPLSDLDGLISIFVLLGIPFIWAAFVVFPHSQRRRVTRLRLLYDFFLSLVTTIILAIALFYQPFSSISLSNHQALLKAVILIMDLISLVIVIYYFLMGDIREVNFAHDWITLAVFCFILTDSVSLITSIHSIDIPVNMVQLGRLLTIILFAMAILIQERQSENKTKYFGEWIVKFQSQVQSYLPLLLGILLCGFVFFDAPVNMLAFWGTLIIALGLVARQGLQVGEDEMQKYADLVNHIAEPTFICSADGSLKLANPALFALAGLTTQMEIKEISFFSLFGSSTEIQRIFSEALISGWSGEIYLTRPDQTRVVVYLSLRLLLGGSKKKLTMAGSAHDLTLQKKQQKELSRANEQINLDRKELEKMNFHLEKMVAEKTKNLTEAYQQLEEQNRTLQQLDQMKSDFVGLVSHELRAPLTNINGGIELLQRIRPMPAKMEENLSLVQAEVLRLTRFVETILDLTTLDAGKMPFYTTPVAIQSVTPVICQLIKYIPGAERVVWETEEPLPYVLADSQALTSIIFHLVDNAIKYAPEGRIKISVWPENGVMNFRIKDQGPGISDDALPFLFQQFYRASSDSQTVYGHGLGLYIVRRMLEAMQGSIVVENNLDRGASFIFRLPIVKEKEIEGVENLIG